ncbi:MAG: hypothetical protein A3G87_04605 [Omnitrophica bacterium RIFCSPLOWO2_12_FULL_50_11]|nr:MAG: hypothetical protein A3G87_04605 [Omnitrophica bacterium RIFCSPLOWO2_12_FULL_50_11]
MEYGNHFDPDIEKLLQLLGKILKKHPKGSEQLAKMMKQNGISLNLCFLTLAPMTNEEMDELNEMYETYMNRSHEAQSPEEGDALEFGLTREDRDFLKRNGIQF